MEKLVQCIGSFTDVVMKNRRIRADLIVGYVGETSTSDWKTEKGKTERRTHYNVNVFFDKNVYATSHYINCKSEEEMQSVLNELDIIMQDLDIIMQDFGLDMRKVK